MLRPIKLCTTDKIEKVNYKKPTLMSPFPVPSGIGKLKELLIWVPEGLRPRRNIGNRPLA